MEIFVIYATNSKCVQHEISQSLPRSTSAALLTPLLHHACTIDMEALAKPKKITAYLHKK